MPKASASRQANFQGLLLESCRKALIQTSYALRLKQRYILTRHNRLRLRYTVSACAGMVMVVGLYFGGHINPNAQQSATEDFVVALEESSPTNEENPFYPFAMRPINVAGLNAHRDQSGQIRRDRNVIESVYLLDQASENQSPAAEERRIEIGKGETLFTALTRNGLDGHESQSIVNQISRHFDMRALRQGQVINITVEPAETETGYSLANLSFAPDHLRTIEVRRDDSGEIVSQLQEKVITETREARMVEIDGSVYGSADKANLPDRITANTIKLFSYAVDFQRDIQPGDKLSVLYNTFKTEDGYVAKTGDIVYAKLNVGPKEYALYRYESKNGQVDYYTAEGKSIRRSEGLMRTPVAYGRLSSGYGVRVHPVLGYTKMHKGVDFASPVGTPVYASGDGVIERASRFSSYGNYIRIRHSSKLSTAYAHLKGYAKGIRPGVRVKQGQLIGYVGTTGRSTGPHLHYEVLVNGVQVNPKSVKVVVDNSLQGEELKRFKNAIKSLSEEYASRSANVKLASNQ